MDCPFCPHSRRMRPGRLRARGYATVWTPAGVGRRWLPSPYDGLVRKRRGEAVVVDGVRPAFHCDGCGAVLVPPDRPADAGVPEDSPAHEDGDEDDGDDS